MTPRSEQPCVRGCLAEGKHYAECPSYGVEGGDCGGCAPAKAHKGTVVCEDCYRRVRGILRNAPDLIGRLRSLTRQGKAAAYSPAKVPGRSTVAPEQIDAELLDALTEIEANLAEWYRFIDPRTLAGLDDVLSVPDWIDSLWEATLDVHLVDDHGDRHAWSLADAAARWGIERRDRHAYPVSDGHEGEVLARMPVREWYDPLLTTAQAAIRAGRTQRAIQKWISDGDLHVAMRYRQADGTVIRAVYASAVDALVARKKPGRPRTVNRDTPSVS